MAGATTLNMDAILKDVYSDTIIETVLKETELLKHFQRKSFTFEGRRLVYPFHVARNASVRAFAAGGALPVAGKQTWVNGYLNVGNVSGTGQIDNDLIKRAKSSGAGAFVNVLDDEMKRLMEDLKYKCDSLALFGGQVKGFCNERKATNATAGAFVGGGASNAGASVAYEYWGDYTPFQNVVLANTDTWVRVKAIRTDTFAEVVPSGVLPGLFVTGYSEANGTVNLANVANAAGQTFTSVGIGSGYGFALLLHDTQLQDAGLTNFGTIDPDFTLEPEGIFAYLGKPTFMGVDRTTATGYVNLQPQVLTQSTAVAPQARAAFTATRLQRLFDNCRQKIGFEPNRIFCSPLFRSSYIALVTATIQAQTKQNTKGVASDVGVDAAKLLVNGHDLEIAHHIPNGGLLIVRMEDWKLAELEKMGFLDRNGRIVEAVQNYDKIQFHVIGRYTHVCEKPAAQGALIGITI